jgi:hypothetical protein
MTGARRVADRRPCGASQSGSAVLLALIVVVALGAGTAALLPLAWSETLLCAAMREAGDCRFAAEAIVMLAITELQVRDSWDAVLSGRMHAGFAGGGRTVTIGGSRRLDLDAIGAGLAGSEPGRWGPDEPRWQLFAWGRAGDLAPGVLNSGVYVAVWAADDERDGDGDAARDANGRVMLRGEAFGAARGRCGVLAIVGREVAAPTPLRLIDWRPQ